jgi:LPPG:FO 2-phospho-L-lactate transferase
MKVAALAGGVGAGKFLRGLIRAMPADEVTVVVNTADDLRIHGLLVCPDIDSVTYWLSGLADRERGWGRHGESFRALGEVERLGGEAWFSLGDLDLGTHLARADLLSSGIGLAETTRHIARGFGVEATILPMSEDPVTTRIETLTSEGEHLDLHFQQYWVARRGRDEVKGVRYDGVETARPAPGVVEAITEADAVLICPSNPVASIGPILAMRDVRKAARDRRVIGVSPIVGGAPILGMADRLMPVAGWEVSAFGAAAAYAGIANGFVIDERDRRLASRIESQFGMSVAVIDTIMTDDDAAERVARVALGLLERS